jgi:hypothetical protein
MEEGGGELHALMWTRSVNEVDSGLRDNTSELKQKGRRMTTHILLSTNYAEFAYLDSKFWMLVIGGKWSV